MFVVVSKDTGHRITFGYPTAKEAQLNADAYAEYVGGSYEVQEIPEQESAKAYPW